MTRIVFLTHSGAPAGAELALLHELRARASATDVLVIFGEDGDMVERFTTAGIPCVVVPLGTRLASARRGGALLQRIGQAVGLLFYTRAVRRELRVRRADVVVGRSLKAAVYGRIATVGLGVPFVWCLHDRLTADYLGRSHVLWSRGLSRVVDALVVNSRSTLATVRTYGKPVLVLPPAVAPTDRAPTSSDVALRVLCLARLSPWKGQDIAIRAFAASLGQSEATLRVVGGALFGEHDYERDLRALVDELGLEGRVELTGHVDDPAAEVAACDVLVHASRIPEPFGLVVMEGMQAGRVVIATSPGGPAEVIDDGVSGLLVDLDSVDSLAAALRRVGAMTTAERATMGDAARSRAVAYDPTSICAEHLGWLTALARGDRLPVLTQAGPA